MDTLTLKDLEDIQEYESGLSEEHSWGVVDRDQLRSLLSLARRQLEHEEGLPGGPASASGACAPPYHSDVPPLGRISKSGALVFKDEDGDECMFWTDEKGFGVSSSENGIFFRKDQIPSLLDHISAWLDTGSFELKPRAVESAVSTPTTDQSAEGKTDTERLNWLEIVIPKSSTGISFEKIPICEGQEGGFCFMKRYHIGQPKKTLRECIDKAMFDETKGDAS